MSLILLEKQGEAWRSRVEGHFILGVHPIETLRKGLPEAMAQAIVDHCAMAGEDVEQFTAQFVREIDALSPVKSPSTIDELEALLNSEPDVAVHITPEGKVVAAPTEPRRARIPRKATAVAPEAEQAPVEPAMDPKEDI